jgi:hypothetical protein
MQEIYPHLPLFEQQGIGIALLSYVGRLSVCITADWDLGSLLREIAGTIEAALDELAQLAGVPGEMHQPVRRVRAAGSGSSR